MSRETQQASPAAGDGSVRYYLITDGLDGGSTAGGFQHAFAVDDFTFNARAAARSPGSGSGTGNPAFDPLTLTLDPGTAADELSKIAFSGAQIKSVQLVGIETDGKGNAETVYDLRLGSAIVSYFAQSTEAYFNLKIDYASLSLTTPAADGSLETYAYNRLTGSSSATPLAPPVPSDEGAAAGFGGDVTWYLTIDGMDGGSTAKGHEGAFELKDFDLSVFGDAISTGSGSGSGRPEILPLSLRFKFGSAADEIFDAMARGLHLDHGVQIVGVGRNSKGIEQTVYDLRTEDTVFRGMGYSDRYPDRLDLDFGRFSLTTTNKAGAAETYGFDVDAGTGLTTPLTAAVAGSENGLNGFKTTYYLTIDGLDGGSTARGHKGAFEIDSLAFSAYRTAAAPGGGSGDTRVQFGDLGFSLAGGTAATKLLSMVSTGAQTALAEISGDSLVNGKLVRNTVDLRLADINVELLNDSKGAGDRLLMNFSQYSLTTKNLTGESETSGFDRTTFTATQSALEAARPVLADGIGEAAKASYYLMIDDIDGGAGVKGRDQAFKIADFHFDAHNFGQPNPGSGGGGGTPIFDALVIDLELGSAAREILRLDGNEIGLTRSFRVVADVPGAKGGVATVYDLRLKNGMVNALEQDSAGLDHITVSYDAFSLTTLNGKGVANTFGFDLATRALVTTPLDAPRTANADAAGPGPMHYYMIIDGVDGGSTVKGERGSFALDDFNFDFSRDDGRDNGKTTVSLDIGSASDELLQLIASGSQIKSVEIVGDRGGRFAADNAYDLRLANAVLTGLDQISAGRDQLTFDFTQVSLSTKNSKGVVATSALDLMQGGVPTSPVSRAKASPEAGLGGLDTTYYLVLDGIDGGSRKAGHKGAFELGSFDFKASLDHSIYGGTGSGSGRPEFDPLSMVLDAGGAADELMDYLATGRQLIAAQIVGDAKVGKLGMETVFDLRVADVTVSEFRQGGKDRLSIDFDAISVTTLNSKGNAETYAYDLDLGSNSTDPLPPPVPDTGVLMF